MANHSNGSSNGDRGDQGSSWFSRLAASLGFSGGVDARAVIEKALQEDDGATFTQRERTMLQRVLDFKDLRLQDVMVPRQNIVAADEGETLADLITLSAKAGHSRIPIYRDTLDEPVGMIHIKDVMGWIIARGEAVSGGSALNFSGADLSTTVAQSGLSRKLIFAPASMSAVDLLIRMQSSHIHLALVVDEHGGTDGLVSIEDLVEEVFGDIEDEHDIGGGPLIAVDDEGYVADARAYVEDVEALIGKPLIAETGDADIDTIGGLIFSMLGRVPAIGEKVEHDSADITFEILDADSRRVKKVKIRPMGAESDNETEGQHSEVAA